MSPGAFLLCASAVADPTRWRMLLALESGVHGVGQLASAVGITSSSATYHVRRMEDAGLVGVERVGRRTLVKRVERRWAAIIRALATAE